MLHDSQFNTYFLCCCTIHSLHVLSHGDLSHQCRGGQSNGRRHTQCMLGHMCIVPFRHNLLFVVVRRCCCCCCCTVRCCGFVVSQCRVWLLLSMVVTVARRFLRDFSFHSVEASVYQRCFRGISNPPSPKQPDFRLNVHPQPRMYDKALAYTGPDPANRRWWRYADHRGGLTPLKTRSRAR